MTTINSQDDFLRALSENPEWKAAVRAQILGEELLQLPARFNAFIEQMTAFVAEQKEINARIAARLDSLESDHNVGSQRWVPDQQRWVPDQPPTTLAL